MLENAIRSIIYILPLLRIDSETFDSLHDSWRMGIKFLLDSSWAKGDRKAIKIKALKPEIA